MQKRSPKRVYVYGLLTLGIYNLAWFAKTRRELMSTAGVHVPSIVWPAIAQVIGSVASGVVLIVVGVSMFWPSHQPDVTTSKQVSVSRACSAEWTLSRAPETAATHHLSTACANQIRQAQSSPRVTVDAGGLTAATIKRLLPLFVLAIALVGVWLWWVVRYVKAVEQATGGRMNQNTAMWLLCATPFGVPILQSVFNNPQGVPEWMGTTPSYGWFRTLLRFSPSVENGPAKTILKVVAIVLAAVVVLMVVFILWVMH